MSDGIRINMTAKEGKSVTLEPLPTGWYVMAITDCSLGEVSGKNDKPGKKSNKGKPMFELELTVQEGDFENRKAWGNAMLFEGALYTISQMLKAQGVEVKEIGDKAEFQVPGFEPNMVPKPEWWMGKVFAVKLQLMGKRRDPVTGQEFNERSEIKGFKSAKDFDVNKSPKKSAEGTAAGKPKTSMLP